MQRKKEYYETILGRHGQMEVLKMYDTLPRAGKRWLCRCDCGKEFIALTRNIATGRTQSCRDCAHKRVNLANTTHGESKTRLYRIWHGIINRCENSNDHTYKYYGALGTSVCQEWRKYENFRNWAVENGYNPYAKRGECTIDRIDTNGNYEPSNCRWVDQYVQCNNQKTNHKVTVDGVTRGICEWSRIIGVNHAALITYSKRHGEESLINYIRERIPNTRTGV